MARSQCAEAGAVGSQQTLLGASPSTCGRPLRAAPPAWATIFALVAEEQRAGPPCRNRECGSAAARPGRRRRSPTGRARRARAILPGRTISRSRGVTAAQRTFNPLGEGASPSGSTKSPARRLANPAGCKPASRAVRFRCRGPISWGRSSVQTERLSRKQQATGAKPVDSTTFWAGMFRAEASLAGSETVEGAIDSRAALALRADLRSVAPLRFALPVHHFPVVALKPLVRETARHGDGLPERC